MAHSSACSPSAADSVVQLCEECGEQEAGSEINPFLCDQCAERWLDNYDGPPDEDYSGPTLSEQHAHEAEQFYRERFK